LGSGRAAETKRGGRGGGRGGDGWWKGRKKTKTKENLWNSYRKIKKRSSVLEPLKGRKREREEGKNREGSKQKPRWGSNYADQLDMVKAACNRTTTPSSGGKRKGKKRKKI